MNAGVTTVGNDPMALLDEYNVFVAQMAGMRAQLIEAGFSREVAEQIVLETLRTSKG